MDNVSNNIDDYNTKRKRKTLIAFDDMIADINTNKTFQAIIKEQFIRCRLFNVSCIYHTIVLSCSKRCQTKFYTLSNNEDS